MPFISLSSLTAVSTLTSFSSVCFPRPRKFFQTVGANSTDCKAVKTIQRALVSNRRRGRSGLDIKSCGGTGRDCEETDSEG